MLHGISSAAHDDFSMMLKSGSYSPSLTFSVKAMSRRDTKWNTGFICVGQVMCVFCACPTSPNSACRQHNGKSNLLNSLQLLLLTHDVFQLLFSQSYWPYSLISKLKTCFSNFTVSVMVYVNIEPTEDRDLFSFATKYSFNSEHCLPEHQFKPCMNDVPI